MNLALIKKVLPLVLLTVLFSCVWGDDFNPPDPKAQEVSIDGEIIGIDALFNLWLQELNNSGNQFLGFSDSAGLYLSGYVISSDEGGNFFEELILQDAPSDPNRGVKLLLDSNPLYTTYEFGRKVYVKLDGLTVGLDSGVLAIGIKQANAVGKIAESELSKVVIRSPEVAVIDPLPISISEFSANKTNLYIRLEEMQFNRRHVMQSYQSTFAAGPEDEFDGERLLESCLEQELTILSTSTFADFKAVLLPSGRGSVDAILSMDYFGEAFNVVVNNPSDIAFTTQDRCDPDTYDCQLPSGGEDVVYQENFELYSDMEGYIQQGWSNVNLHQGDILFKIGNFSANNYVQISGYQSGEETIETWLVSPRVDMDLTSAEQLMFDVQASYDNGALLDVFFSTDYKGSVQQANWLQLDAVIPNGPEDGFGDFQTVGPINISCMEGAVHFAFVYTGNDPDATTRFHIDNIVISGNDQ